MNAVVSTQRGVGTLDSFLRWHLDGAGFDFVYLYLDAPEEDAATLGRVLSRHPEWTGRVSVLEANEDFRAREAYATLPSWSDVARSVASMVQSRQRLNCEHCMRLCSAAGVRWLLHIDSDELFMPAAGEGARAHFDRLEDQGCWQFTYRNLEAVATSPPAAITIATTAAAATTTTTTTTATIATIADHDHDHDDDAASDAADDGDDDADHFAHVCVFKQHEDALPSGLSIVSIPW